MAAAQAHVEDEGADGAAAEEWMSLLVVWARAHKTIGLAVMRP